MEFRYSGAAGITADRVADKSFNNAKIRRAWMYNCGIFVDEPISLSLSFFFSLSLSLPSPFSSFFSYPFSSLSRLHCLQAMLERRRNTSIFHSGKMSANGNFLKMTRRSPASPPFRFEEGDIVLNLDLPSIPASKHYRFHSPRFESTDNRRRPPRI